MDKLQPPMFLVPVIAVIMVLVCYFILLRKVFRKTLFKRFIFVTCSLAIIVNLAWEIIQGPLYNGFAFSISHVAFCGLASLADAIMVMLMYFSLAFIYKNPLWIEDITLQRTLTIMFIGGVGAILSEMRHLSLGNWSYTSSMPVIPFVYAGLAPTLQFLILPTLIFYLSFIISKKVELIR